MWNPTQPERRSTTLNELKELRYSLTMRQLLAMRTHDASTLALVESELQEVEEQIQRMQFR